MSRIDKRRNDELRKVKITPNFTKMAQGSVLMEMGETKVICTAMIQEGVPPFMKDLGKGWLTAEYSMLPSATPQRKKRENAKNGADGRSTEISRLIGRALRSAFNLEILGERTICVDCDVIQADGGTRTAAITGAFVAICNALDALKKCGTIPDLVYEKGMMAAVSVGYVEGNALLDLCYLEDSNAEADVNIIMLGEDFVEIQGTGEKRALRRYELDTLLDLGMKGIAELYTAQAKLL